MTYINPLANALPQSFAAHQELSTDKTRQMREKLLLVPQSAAPQTDQFEHQIENAQEAAPIHEEARQKRQPRGRRQQHLEEEPTEEEAEPAHIDLKG